MLLGANYAPSQRLGANRANPNVGQAQAFL
jgi:hypothetical protein